MYIPPQFEVADRTWARELIDRYSFGMLVTADADYPRVSHLPLVAAERDDGLWIVGHVARANPHVEAIRNKKLATLVFAGPHAYVSASWYEEPYVTVPTWNYTAVHACGRLHPYDAWSAVTLLSKRMERGKNGPWDPERLTVEYRESQLRGIVAFELRADEIYAKAKLSQNRTIADGLRVIEHLETSEDQTDRACAAEMIRTLRDAEPM
ncbi:MAG TPA: FMN-binding negative transcriptional regulator [Candidatus Cybelea sp.]|jgi:transcriptional regulator